MTYIEKFWRDAKAEDVVRVMAGETVLARFRDDIEPWSTPRELMGYKTLKKNGVRWIGPFESWAQCQVYAPHQWWLDKPEPGEGYRLLGKFPDEPVQSGDFIKNTSGGWTELANGCNPAQAEGIWYRRRIEQPKPEPKHYILQVGDTVRTPSGRQAIVTEIGIEVT